MTREEAIDVLSDFRKFTLSILGKSIYAERCSALDMAIEALSAELTATNTEKSSNCGDLISREAVINITAETGALETQRRVKQLPSADRPAGEWEEMEILCNPYPPLFCVECSECGYRVGRETYLDLENTFNFCPNCGAYMRNQNNEQR